MENVLYLLGILVALATGYFLGQKFSNKAKENNRLENELNEKQQELEILRNRVNQHFEKTATLFNQVSDSYQHLYDHMAKSSSQLCSTQNFQATLPVSPEVSDSNESLPENFDNIHKTNTHTDNLFDANNLYKAHDYRNQPLESDETDSTNSTATDENKEQEKVVDIDSAKIPNPARDYATKD